MAKFQKVGVVLRGDKGPFLVMGDSKAKSKNYQFEVELTVRDGNGKEVLRVKNPLLNMFDPRKRPGIKEEDAARLSDKLRYEVMVKASD